MLSVQMLKRVSRATVSIPLGCRCLGYACVSWGYIKSVQLWNVIVVRYMSQSQLPWTVGLLSKAFPWLSPFFPFSSLSIHGGFHLSRTGTLDLALTSAPLALAGEGFLCVEMCEKKCEGNLMDWELTGFQVVSSLRHAAATIPATT